MKLSDIHKQFILEAELPMFATQGVPLQPKEDDSGPIIPMARWVISSKTGALTKTYSFQNLDSKVVFLKELLEHEQVTRHSPRLTVDEDQITVEYITRDANKVTELDKEAARFCDVLFKDVLQMKL